MTECQIESLDDWIELTQVVVFQLGDSSGCVYQHVCPRLRLQRLKVYPSVAFTILCSLCSTASPTAAVIVQVSALLCLLLFEIHLLRRALETGLMMRYNTSARMHGIAYLFGMRQVSNVFDIEYPDSCNSPCKRLQVTMHLDRLKLLHILHLLKSTGAGYHDSYHRGIVPDRFFQLLD